MCLLCHIYGFKSFLKLLAVTRLVLRQFEKNLQVLHMQGPYSFLADSVRGKPRQVFYVGKRVGVITIVLIKLMWVLIIKMIIIMMTKIYCCCGCVHGVYIYICIRNIYVSMFHQLKSSLAHPPTLLQPILQALANSDVIKNPNIQFKQTERILLWKSSFHPSFSCYYHHHHHHHHRH